MVYLLDLLDANVDMRNFPDLAVCALGADVDRVKREIEEVIGLDCSNAILASAKQVRWDRLVLSLR